MAADDSYSEDEVRAIIDRALQDQPGRTLNHEDLLAVASEIGIGPEALESAAAHIREARETDEAKRQIVSRRRRHFGSHLWTYVVINAFLFAVNFLTSPGAWWVLFPVVLWGLALLFHARIALAGHVSERAIEREKHRKRVDATRSAVRAAAQDRALRVRIGASSEIDNERAAPKQQTRQNP